MGLQEVDKFSEAFKNPEFVKLFEEYAKEVSDPKVGKQGTTC
jgi:dynein assembly factor 2